MAAVEPQVIRIGIFEKSLFIFFFLCWLLLHHSLTLVLEGLAEGGVRCGVGHLCIVCRVYRRQVVVVLRGLRHREDGDRLLLLRSELALADEGKRDDDDDDERAGAAEDAVYNVCREIR